MANKFPKSQQGANGRKRKIFKLFLKKVLDKRKEISYNDFPFKKPRSAFDL